MTLDEAIQLVLREGYPREDGLIVALRFRVPPRPGLLADLSRALKAVRSAHQGRSAIDGTLAYALFNLSFHVQGQHDGWLFTGSDRPEGLDEALALLYELVEDVFLAVAGDISRFEADPASDVAGPSDAH